MVWVYFFASAGTERFFPLNFERKVLVFPRFGNFCFRAVHAAAVPAASNSVRAESRVPREDARGEQPRWDDTAADAGNLTGTRAEGKW